MHALLAKTVQKVIFLKVDVVLKLIKPSKLTVLYCRLTSFRNDKLFNVNQETSIGHLRTLHNSAKNYDVLFVFIVVKTAHVLKSRNLFRRQRINVESGGDRN